MLNKPRCSLTHSADWFVVAQILQHLRAWSASRPGSRVLAVADAVTYPWGIIMFMLFKTLLDAVTYTSYILDPQMTAAWSSSISASHEHGLAVAALNAE